MFAVLGFLLVGELTHMRSMCVGVAETGVEHRSPAMRHKDTFSFLVLFTDQKYQKSARRTHAVLLPNLTMSRRRQPTHCVHWLIPAACTSYSQEVVRGKCVRQGLMVQVGSFAALRGFSHTTRANISHEETEQIRARIACTPAEKWVAGVNLASALTEVTISLLQWEKGDRDSGG